MPKANIYNQEGHITGQLELSPKFFGAKINPTFVHEMVVAQQANSRTHTGHTKTRGEVSGGGIKPWKQKGTGRARQGSIRSPQWVGGGIAHGPTSARNFSVKINRKAKRQALFMALSDKVADEKLLVLEPPVFSEVKTKVAGAMLKKLPLGRRALIVIPGSDQKFMRMVKNIPAVKLVTVQTLSLVDVVGVPTIVFQKDAIPAFEKIYGAI